MLRVLFLVAALGQLQVTTRSVVQSAYRLHLASHVGFLVPFPADANVDGWNAVFERLCDDASTVFLNMQSVISSLWRPVPACTCSGHQAISGGSCPARCACAGCPTGNAF